MSHMNESCHIGMSHVTYEWVMSHMNESCHKWTRHVTYEWVMSHVNESRHIWMSHVPYEWVMSHTMTCSVYHLTSTISKVISHMNESCHIHTSHVTYNWVMSHSIESCHTPWRAARIYLHGHSQKSARYWIILRGHVMLQLIADRVAKNLEIISKTFTTNQNSAHGLYDESR